MSSARTGILRFVVGSRPTEPQSSFAVASCYYRCASIASSRRCIILGGEAVLMQCPKCQQENPAQARFCLQCGNGLKLSCSKCGTELPPAARFCFSCGAQVGAAAAPTSAASPNSYTPRHLAEKILTSKGVVEGERKQVTVLFADLKSSLELLADRDPEEARKIIDPVLNLMMDAVHRYEGTVNQVLGDGVMALFGAPLAHEDHAVRACYAALAMQAEIRRHSQELRRSHGIEVQTRVGLNSGEVVVRAIGNDLSMEYSAVGQTTHLASRMEQLANPGTIRLTMETLRLSEGFVQVAPLGPVPVKGLPDPVEVYELTGALTLRTRMQASAARGLTRFVGRATELDVLTDALKRAGAGRGQIVALVGEPGVGKSRLVWEFTHSHRTDGWLVLEAGSVSYGKATPYRPLIDLLKVYFQIEDRDSARRVREKVAGKLVTLERSLESTLPAFLSTLNVPFEDAEWTALHPSQRRQRILDTCKRLVLRESQVQPLVLVFEDLHWIDEETQAFLDSLIESVPTARLLLLVNYRPEYQHGWGQKTFYRLVRIDPLPAESAEELLLGLLGTDPGLQPLRDLLIERSEGNPFFIEESVRTLVETRALVGERGQYRLASSLADIQVPSRVQAVIAARIDRLMPEHKQLLQAAAVIGKDVPFALLRAIADLPESELRLGLAHLQAAEFLYETTLFPDLEYTFKHALTHEVAYSGILQARRRVVHARITDAIETLYKERLGEYLERLCYHAVRGELWERAYKFLRQAGLKALGRSANREAVNYFEQALEALQQLPESNETNQHAIDLRIELRSALHPLGEFDAVAETLRKAEALAKNLGDERRQGRVLSYLAQSFRLSGDYKSAIQAGQRALAIGEKFGDFGIQAPANFHLGQAFFHLGDHNRAAEYHFNNIRALEGELAKDRLGMAGFPVVFSQGHLAWALGELGRFPEGIAAWQAAMRLAEEVKHPFSEAFAKYCGGFLYLRKGEPEKAIAQLEPGLALCQSMNVRLELPFVATFLGTAYTLSGRVSDGIALLEQAIEEMTTLKIMSGQSWLVGFLALGYLLGGRVQQALELAQRANDMARQYEEHGWIAWTNYALGHAHSARGDAASGAAVAAFKEALEGAQALGMRPLAARCELSLGQLCRRVHDEQSAHAYLTRAVSQLRDMEMPLWVQRAEAELQGLHAHA